MTENTRRGAWWEHARSRDSSSRCAAGLVLAVWVCGRPPSLWASPRRTKPCRKTRQLVELPTSSASMLCEKVVHWKNKSQTTRRRSLGLLPGVLGCCVRGFVDSEHSRHPRRESSADECVGGARLASWAARNAHFRSQRMPDLYHSFSSVKGEQQASCDDQERQERRPGRRQARKQNSSIHLTTFVVDGCAGDSRAGRG